MPSSLAFQIPASKLSMGQSSKLTRFSSIAILELSLNNKKIPVTKSINRLGWGDNDFVPFVDNYKYDGDISFKSVY